MQYRAPSLRVTEEHNNIRRRSSGQPKAGSIMGEGEHLLSRIDDDDLLVNEHTVLLVPHPNVTASSSAVLPFAQHFEDNSVTQHNWDGNPITSFSPIPLTPPCPETVSCAPSGLSLQPANTPTIEVSRIPSPNFTDPKAQVGRVPGTFHAFLPRGLNIVSLGMPVMSFLSSTPASRRPQSVRTESDRSVQSTISTISTVSVDSGHKTLIPSIGTTAKFTHKWPPPGSMRKMNLRGGSLNESMGLELSQTFIAAMEDGQALGVDDAHTWTHFKWCMLLSVSSVFSYGAVGLVCAIMTWFKAWDKADVMNVADNDILVIITLTASMLVFTALVGICGVFLNSRPILAAYTLLLWPALVSLLAIGYVSYKRVTFLLDHKLNLAWSQYYTSLGRLLIQDSLQCCGYYSALHEATPSSRCYPRSPLPGCKGKLYRFECDNLATIWSAAFALVLLHILNILVALLCANHVTKTFGSGITPKQYRLSGKDVKADADKILAELNRSGKQFSDVTR